MFESMLSRFGELQERATVRTVFGEPYHVDGRTIVPVAKVTYGYGFGGGRANGASDESDAAPNGERRDVDGRTARAGRGVRSGAGGGGGAGVSLRPVAVLEINGGKTKIRPIVDVTRLVLAVLALAAWNVFWITYTVRRKHR